MKYSSYWNLTTEFPHGIEKLSHFVVILEGKCRDL